MKLSVIGCGRWGTFLAWYLERSGSEVTLYGRKGSKRMEQLLSTRSNGVTALPPSVRLTQDLPTALQTDTLVISVGSQSLRGLLREIAPWAAGKLRLVLCMKGLETGTGKRLSTIVKEELGEGTPVAVWLGPGHVQEFTAGIPNCMVIDSEDEALKEELISAFSSQLIRFYYGRDMIGNEIGGASKNVIGIAAGMLDGLGLSSLKGALMSRGTREIARLIQAMGGQRALRLRAVPSGGLRSHSVLPVQPQPPLWGGLCAGGRIHRAGRGLRHSEGPGPTGGGTKGVPAHLQSSGPGALSGSQPQGNPGWVILPQLETGILKRGQRPNRKGALGTLPRAPFVILFSCCYSLE